MKEKYRALIVLVLGVTGLIIVAVNTSLPVATGVYIMFLAQNVENTGKYLPHNQQIND